MVSGDVSSITQTQLEAVEAAIANAAGVPVDTVTGTAVAASVRISVDMQAASAMAADALTSTLSAWLATPSAVSSLQTASGLTLETPPPHARSIVTTVIVLAPSVPPMSLPATPPITPVPAQSGRGSSVDLFAILVGVLSSLAALTLLVLGWHLLRPGFGARRSRQRAAKVVLVAAPAGGLANAMGKGMHATSATPSCDDMSYRGHVLQTTCL